MRKLLVLVAVLWGCGETDILKQDVRGIDEVEKAKLITQLWQRCQKGVLDAQTLTVKETVSPEKASEERVSVGNGRIRMLEEALPYGRRGFELARTTAEQCNYWYAFCASFLGWEYDIVGQIQVKQGKERGDQELVKAGEERRAKAQLALREGTDALLHFRDAYTGRTIDRLRLVQIYMWLEINYELAGDLRSAYLVTRELVAKLDGLKREGATAAEVDPVLDKYTKLLGSLEQKMRAELVPIPK